MSTDQQTETPEHVQPVVKSVQQFRGNNDDISEHESKMLAGNMLRDKFRLEGLRMDTDPVSSAPMSARLIAEGTDWVPWEGPGKPDGQVITWSATGVPATIDPLPLEGGVIGADGAYTVAVPANISNEGGPLRIKHNLGTMRGARSVTVSAFGATGPIGYMFTQALTQDEEHMEVMGGTVMIRVVADAEPPAQG